MWAIPSISACLFESNPDFSHAPGGTSFGESTGGMTASVGDSAGMAVSAGGSTGSSLDSTGQSASGGEDGLPEIACEGVGPLVVGAANEYAGPRVAVSGDELGLLWDRARTFSRVDLEGATIGLDEQPLDYDVWTTDLEFVDGRYILTYETTFHGELHQVYMRSRLAAATWGDPVRVSQGDESLPAAAYLFESTWAPPDVLLAGWRANTVDFGFSVFDRDGSILGSGVASIGYSTRPRRVFPRDDGFDLLIAHDDNAHSLLVFDSNYELVEQRYLFDGYSALVDDGPRYTASTVVMDQLVLGAHDGQVFVGELTQLDSGPMDVVELQMTGTNGNYAIVWRSADAGNPLELAHVRDGQIERRRLHENAGARFELVDTGAHFAIAWVAMSDRGGYDVMLERVCW